MSTQETPSRPPLPTTAAEAVLSSVPRRAASNLGRKWQRVRKVVLWILIAGLVTHLSLNIWATIQLNRELALLRSRGEITSLPALIGPPVPDARNAAPLYLKAHAALTDAALQKLKKAQRSGLEALTPQSQQEALTADELQQNQAAVALVREAAARPDCRFPVDWSNPVSALLPHLGKMRLLAWLMHDQAVSEAVNGQQQQALADTAIIFQMARHVSMSPTLIENLVALAIEGVAHTALGEVLDHTHLTAAEGHEFLAELHTVDWPVAFGHAMNGERAFGIWVFGSIGQDLSRLNVYAGSSTDPPPPLYLRPLWFVAGLLWSPFQKLDETLYLRFINESAQRLSRPVGDTVDSAPDPDAELHRIPLYAVITRLMLPANSQLYPRRARAEIYHRFDTLAVALCVYRTAMGHYPNTIQDAKRVWGDLHPVDPYSSQPFIYRVEGQSYELYSVGENRRDDGGKTHKPSGADDIAWRH